MRKKECKKGVSFIKNAPVTALLWMSAPPILISLLSLLHKIEHAAPLTEAKASYLGGLLEYHAAAVMILTVGLSLLHLITKKKNHAV